MSITYEPIASTTLSTNTASITFSSIPSTYTDLIIAGQIRSARTGEITDQYTFVFNSDTGSNYSSTTLYDNDEASPKVTRSGNASNIGLTRCPGPNGTANAFGTVLANIQNYSNSTTFKSILTRWGSQGDATFYFLGETVTLWRNTNAITSIEVKSVSSVNLATGTSLTLYGIKAE